MFWLLISHMTIEGVIRQIADIDRFYLLTSMVICTLLTVFAGLRWYYVIKATGHSLSWFRTLEITMIGTFFNQLLPSAMGGDLARIPYAHRAGLPLMTAVNSIVLDRLLAMVALIILVLGCLPISFTIVSNPQARWGLVLIALGGLVGIFLLLSIKHMPGLMSRYSAFNYLHNLSKLLHTALFRRHAPAIISYGIMTHLGRVLAVHALAKGMSLDVTFYESLILVPPAMLLTALPISIGGWGIREGSFVMAFGLLGLASESAFALSSLFGLTTVAAALIGGFFWLLHRQSV